LEFASYVSKLKGEPEEKGPFITKTENLLKDKNFEQVFELFAASTSILLEAPEKGIKIYLSRGSVYKSINLI
jgi:hypothetical protein